MRQRARDLEPALVAVRQVLRQLVADAPQADVGEQLLGAPIGGLPPRVRAFGVLKKASAGLASMRACIPIITFSRAVMFLNRRMFWNVRPMPAWTISLGFALR